MANYTIRAVATKTGLNPATLRTWERRYNAVGPVREANGSRCYSEDAVRRIHLLKQATEQGHAIRHLAQMDDLALETLVLSAPIHAERDNLAVACIEQLLNSIDAMDLSCFERLVATAALAFAPASLVEEVLCPTLKAVGERWHDGRLSIAQEHAVSASLSNVLGALIRSYPVPAGAPPVVLATLPGERHELALLMARYVLVGLGIPVVYLGIDLPAAEIAETAHKHGSHTIALSTIHGEGAAQQRAHLEELLRCVGPDLEILVGGALGDMVLQGLADSRVRRVRSLRALEQHCWLARN